jgi:hypothetical protein
MFLTALDISMTVCHTCGPTCCTYAMNCENPFEDPSPFPQVANSPVIRSIHPRSAGAYGRNAPTIPANPVTTLPVDFPSPVIAVGTRLVRLFRNCVQNWLLAALPTSVSSPPTAVAAPRTIGVSPGSALLIRLSPRPKSGSTSGSSAFAQPEKAAVRPFQSPISLRSAGVNAAIDAASFAFAPAPCRLACATARRAAATWSAEFRSVRATSARAFARARSDSVMRWFDAVSRSRAVRTASDPLTPAFWAALSSAIVR